MELDRASSELADRPRSILLLESGSMGASDLLCGQLLKSDDDDATVSLILVTLVQPPGTRLSVREDVTGDLPDETVAVTLDGVYLDGTPEGVDVRTVSDPGNLTRLGVTLTEALAAVEGTRPLFCFHSLSVLLQYASPDRVYRFLSVLKTHLDAAGATAHFHLAPSSHDEQTVEAFRHLFDEVVTADD